MNILVTGANGQLGHEMQICAKNSNHKFVFTDVAEGYEKLDITNLDAIREKVKENDIQVIVNCAAYTNVDKAESDFDLANLLNNTAAGNLAQAMKELLDTSNEIKIIGTRHGEKLYESLVSREEMARSEDLGGYYRIPADSRDLNYAKYFVEGEVEVSNIDDYTSHNTHRLNVEGVKQTLLKLDIIREAVNA